MASAIAGPSSASAGPPPGTSMNTHIPAHPAFPSLIPRNLIPQPSFNPLKDKRPSTTEQLIGFIGTHGRGNQAIVDNVIPTLLVMTGHKIPGQVGRDAEEDKKMWGFGGDDGGGKGAGAGGKGGEGTGGAGGKGVAKGKGKEVDERVRQAERVIAALPAHNPGDDELARSAAIYLFILTARLELEDTQMNHISTIDFATRLIAVGDVDQLRACGPRLATFAWDLLEVGKCIRQQALALNAIHMLLNKCYGPGQLSGAHAAFLHGCLAARQYDMARPFLTGVYIDIKQSQPSYHDIITFFHHAGLICASLKEWELAVEHFSVCVSVPTVAASAIQLAAAKRAYLCGLLHNGKLPHFPKYISLALSRPFERHLSTYLELGKMYMGANWAKVIEIAGNKLFREDTNFGLVKQVVASIPAQRVMIVSETISRLTLGDLMKRLGAQGEEDEQAVLDLLDTLNATGKLSTRITDNTTSSARIITFLPDSHTQNFDSPEALLRLKGMTRLSDFLDQEMRRASREAGIGEAYLKKQMHQLESKGRGDTLGPGTGLDMGMMGLEGEGRKVRGVGGNMGDMGF